MVLPRTNALGSDSAVWAAPPRLGILPSPLLASLSSPSPTPVFELWQALNLVKHGYDIVVWNRSPDPCDDLAAGGAKARRGARAGCVWGKVSAGTLRRRSRPCA